MPAKFASDRVRNPGIVRLARHRIVLALSFGESDRVNRRKIDYVESHRLGVIDARKAIPEFGTFTATAFGGSWKKFIPRGELCFRPIDRNLKIWLKICAQVEV